MPDSSTIKEVVTEAAKKLSPLPEIPATPPTTPASTISFILLVTAAVLLIVLGLYYLWLQVCVFIGLFMKKKHQTPAEPKRIAVLTCARNEEAVIGDLIDSIGKQEYPKEKLSVFVVAHNCTDNTAKVAESLGAEVFVRNNESDCCKGDALRFGLERLKETHGGEFDIITIFDADNVAGKDFMREINGAIAGGADIVQGFRAAKNRHENWVSELFSSYWLGTTYFQNMPHTKLKLPVTVSGTGFAFRADVLGDEGWNTCTLLEDIEFSVQQIMKGKTIVSAPMAVFYDEQPTSLKVALKQRYRWSVAGTDLMKKYIGRVFRWIPKGKLSAVKLLLDVGINPILTGSVVGAICLLAGRILGGASFGEMMFHLGKDILGVWLMSLPMAAFLLIREHEPLQKNWSTIFLLGASLLISFVFAVVSFFVPKPKWTPIRHECHATVDELEKDK